MIRGKRGRKRRHSREATRMARADWRWNIIFAKDEIKRAVRIPGDRVLKSDSLSTHLDPKSVVARFEKSADEREVEG
jgi:hypothetical protein